MSKVKQIRKRMFDTRDFKKRLELMFLIRGIDWQAKGKATAATVTDPLELTWE